MSDTPTIAGTLGKFIHATRYEDLPADVVEQAKSRLLDSLSTAIASRGLPVPSVALRFASAGSGEATVYGSSRGYAPVDAAFVNATLINGTTHDDFVSKSHPGAVVVPAITAIGELCNSTGRDMLVALVLGYDIVARAYLGGPGMLPRFRASGVAGAVGAAATAGKLLGLAPAEMSHALGLSTMFASGFGEGFRSGTMDVKLNVGWACRSGVSAALLAQCGGTASPTVFEGESGFYMAFANSREHAQAAVQALGAPYLISATTYKERPVCIFVQTPVELALAMRAEHKLDATRIERVIIHAPDATYTNPGYQNRAPFATPLQARISVRFTTAAALLGRPVDDYDYYYSFASDHEVLALAERIDLALPTSETERVQLEIRYEGKTLGKSGVEMDTLRPTLAKSISKFSRLVEPHLGSKTTALLETVLHLERLENVRELTGQLRASSEQSEHHS